MISSQNNEDIGILYGIITDSTEKINTLDKTQLGLCESPKITVTSPQRVDPGFFYKSYINYLITTTPLNLKVRRKYSDFEWLRGIFSNYYIGNIVPSLTNKSKFFKDYFEESFLIKRGRKFERFMNYLLTDPIIKNSQLLYHFISIEKEEDFEAIKQTFEKMKPPENINENKNLLGQANIEINKTKEEYYDNIKNKVHSKENLFMTLNQNIKLLNTKIKDLCLHLEVISKNFQDLSTSNTIQFDGEKAIQIYNSFNKLFKDWSNTLQKHNEIICTDIREYFKHVKNNYNSIDNLIKLVDTNRSNFKTHEKTLIGKKDSLIQKGYINKTDRIDEEQKRTVLMSIIPEETNDVIRLKKIYGYYLNRFVEEFERLKSVNGQWHSAILKNTSIKIIDIYEDFQKNHMDSINAIG